MKQQALTTRVAAALFAIVIVAWGLNWPVTKLIVAEMTPLWATAIRTAIAAVALFFLLYARRELIVPKRADIPVVIAIGLFHMVGFSALMTIGLQYVPAGRSVVLGYTTPLWVTPAAWFFLAEPMSSRRLLGILLGLVGLAVLFNPSTFDWSNRDSLFGNALLLLAAASWSVSIVYIRAHKWVASPLQLALWEVLLATSVLTILAALVEPLPALEGSAQLWLSLAYSGLVGTALGFWAMAVVNRSMPATTTALGVLATPVVGIITAALLLGEGIDLPLIVATLMILGGIALGTLPPPRRSNG